MYYKKIFINWSDIDANGHLSHLAYHRFTSNIRINMIYDQDIDISYDIINKNIGAILFYEKIYYFKEFLPMNFIYITIEIAGLSNDGKFYKIYHNFYNKNGIHSAFLEIIGSWLNLKNRKIISPPKKILNAIKKYPISKDFKKLTQSDTRVQGIKSNNINFKFK